MLKLFVRHIEHLIPGLTQAQTQQICAACVFKRLRKKEQVLREGEVSHTKIFVCAGLLRNFSIDDNGTEHILRFTDAGNWTVDPESYFSGLPSKYNIDALEQSEVALVGHERLEKLVQAIPPLAEYFIKMTTTTLGLVQQRVLNSISGTTEEKYLHFMQTYPGIFQRVPLHMVASYIGVSRETLTRIRQGMAVGS